MEGVRALLEQLRTHASDAEAAHRLLALLQCSWLDREDLRTAAGESGAVECVAELLPVHAGNATVLTTTCSVLCSLCNIPANAQRAAGAGAIEALVAAMRVHAFNAVVQEQGSFALYSFLDNELAYEMRVTHAGGVEVLVAALHTHLLSEPVLVGALFALRLVVRDDDSAVLVSHTSAAESVVAAMQAFPANDQIQARGSLILNNIAVASVAATTAAVRAGACEICIAALSAHSGKSMVVHAVCMALGQFCTVHDTLKRIHAAHGVSMMLAVLRTHAADGGVCGAAAFCLGNLAALTLSQADSVAAAQAVMQTMRMHAADDTVQHFGCVTLRNVSVEAPGGVFTALVAGGAPEVVVTALRMHGANDDLLVNGYDLLVRLMAVDSTVAKRAIAAGALQLQTECASEESTKLRDDVIRGLNRAFADADAAMAALLAEEDAAPSKSKQNVKGKSKSKSKGKGKKAGGARQAGAASSNADADDSAAADAAADAEADEAAAVEAGAPSDAAAAAADDAAPATADEASAVQDVPAPVPAADAAAAEDNDASAAGASAAADAPPDAGASHAMLHELYPWLQQEADAAASAAAAPPPQQQQQQQQPGPAAPLPGPPPHRPPMGHAGASCSAAAGPSHLPPAPHASQAAAHSQAAAALPVFLAGLALQHAPPAAAAPPPVPPRAMRECCVCLADVPIEALLLLLPCAHRCVCATCADVLLALPVPDARRCPKCREPIVRASPVFED
jgi:hypothetical protein